MPKQDSKNFSDAFPLIVIFIALMQAHGTGQIVVAAIAAFATSSFIPVVAGLAWAPLLKRAGLWWTSLFLVLAIVAAVAGIRLGGFHDVDHVLTSAAISGLLFSWMLAAMNAAEDSKSPDRRSGPTLIRSRLMRGRRSALQ